MKFNLKNRPSPVPAVLGYVYDGDQIDEWFEGFEKELREELEKEQEFYNRTKTAAKGISRMKLEWIKEILGDE